MTSSFIRSANFVNQGVDGDVNDNHEDDEDEYEDDDEDVPGTGNCTYQCNLFFLHQTCVLV
jgi:hypothetical protein